MNVLSRAFILETVVKALLFAGPVIGTGYSSYMRLGQLEQQLSAIERQYVRKDVQELREAHTQRTLEVILEELKELRSELRAEAQRRSR